MEERSHYSIVELYVFGSYARGAAQCADLDLIVRVEVHSGSPPREADVRRRLVGGSRQVDVLVERGDGSYTKQFEESLLIWTPDAPDWESVVRAIPTSDSVGRHARKTDALGLTLKRLRTTRAEAEMVVDLAADGFLEIEWLGPADPTPRAPHIQRRMEQASFGKKTKAVLGSAVDIALLQLEEAEQPHAGWRRRNGSAFNLDGVKVHIGTPPLSVGVLDRMDTHTLVLFPHHKRNHADGALVIRRGPSHPLRAAFQHVEVFVVSVDGAPLLTVPYDEAVSWRSDEYLECFRGRDEAEACLPDESVTSISGDALLRIAGRIHGLLLDEQRVPLQHRNGFGVLRALRQFLRGEAVGPIAWEHEWTDDPDEREWLDKRRRHLR